MDADATISSVELSVAAADLDAVSRFYGSWGAGAHRLSAERLSLSIGVATVTFVGVADGARPFHHFALLVPGDRFDVARDWAAACYGLLSEESSGETRFEFTDWNAVACYIEDPASNIVELIAHRTLEPSGASGPFTAGELLAVSEVGLVVADPRAALAALKEGGVPVWAGAVDSEHGLTFAGRQAHTLIVGPVGRPWFPTSRAAEPHAAAVTITAGAGARVDVAVRDGALTAHRVPAVSL